MKVQAPHVCQLFDSDESRADAVAAFVAEGLEANERVVIVVRPVNWARIMERLSARGVRVDREIGRGQIVVKDALDTLRRISPRGTPDAAAFADIIGTAVRELTALGPLRAYGEMVDILAQRGEFNEAIALEELWNRLGASTPFLLMCAYSAAHFLARATHRSLRDICQAHTGVLRGSGDALADWLLTAAHTPFGSSSTLSH